MRGKMENLIEEKRRIRKKLLYTNDDYLFTRPIIARFLAVMELDRDLDRHGVKERRLNEETALESSGRRGGKRSKKARWVREGGKEKREGEGEEAAVARDRAGWKFIASARKKVVRPAAAHVPLVAPASPLFPLPCLTYVFPCKR